MNEKLAKEILCNNIGKNGEIYGIYFSWRVGDKEACLDGDFTAEELKAIAWWMKNKTPNK